MTLCFTGIIDFLISNHPMVEKLRNEVVFKIIPMINPDGVVLGNYRYKIFIFVVELILRAECKLLNHFSLVDLLPFIKDSMCVLKLIEFKIIIIVVERSRKKT